MPKLGEYLVQAGALTQPQFEEAYRAQRVHGGRIGTNLVEQGFLILDELAEHLSAFHQTPMPPPEWLEEPDPKALKLVPMSLIRRFSFLPLKLERDCIHVAMVDPTDAEQLDFLNAAASRPVRAYVLPEVRILYWLEMHCGIDRHPRFVNLAARARHTGLGPQTGDSFFTPEPGRVQRDERVLPEPPRISVDPFEFQIGENDSEASELLLEEMITVDEGVPAAAAASETSFCAPADPGEIAALEAQLQGANERDDVIELGLRIARGFARSAALFVVRGSKVVAHRSATDAGIQRLEGIELPVGAPSIFSHPAATGTPFRGRPPHDGMDGRVLAAMDRPEAHEVLIQPIAIRGRVVNLLYVDNGGDALADTSAAAITTLGDTMARAYERLILDAKRSTSDDA